MGRLAWIIPAALGGALRFYHAASFSGVWEPHINRGEGYYEGAINFLGYHVLADRVPSFLPSGARGPLYQAFIVLVEFFSSAPHPGHILYAQAALSTLAIIAIYEIGSELDSPWAGFLAAMWMALDFAQIETTAQLDISGFYPLATLALAAALISWIRAPAPKRTLVLALALAATLLCRSAQYAFPFLIILACSTLPRWKAARRALPLLGGVFALLLGLVMGAYYLRFGRLVTIDAEIGSPRFYATTVGDSACCVGDQIRRYQAASADGGLDADGPVLRRGLRNVRERPFLFIKSFLKNGVAFWRPYAPALALGLLAVYAHGLEPGFQALLLALLSFLGYHVLVVYRWHSDAVLPLLAVFAGLGLAGATRRLAGVRLTDEFFRRPRDAGGARAVLVAVFAGLYAVVLLIFAAEGLSYPGGRIAGALADPSSSVHRAPLALLDLSVARSRGLYGLAERADVLSAMGLYERACRDLTRLARQNPSSAVLAGRARSCAAESGLGLEGLGLIKARLLADPRLRGMVSDLRLSSPCDWWGWSEPDSGASGYLDRCIKADPRNPARLQSRGIYRYRSGRKAESIADFRAASRLDPSSVQANLSLSTVLYELGRFQDALPPAERAVALAGGDPAMYAAALETRASVRSALKPGAR